MERASEEREQVTRAQLQSYDSGLDLRWFQAIRRYAVCARWPIGDLRYQLIQTGQMEDEPFDILGWLTVDTQSASCEGLNLESGVEKQLFEILRRSDNTKTDWKQRVLDYAEKNRKLKESRKAEVAQQAEDIARDLEYMAGHNEESRMRRIMTDIAKEGLANE